MEEKSSLSTVVATLPTIASWNVDSRLQAPVNILIFGLMRRKKGFEIGIEIAKYIGSLDKEHPLSNVRVIYACKPHEPDLFCELILGKFKDSQEVRNALSEISSKKNISEMKEELELVKRERLSMFVNDLLDNLDCDIETKKEVQSKLQINTALKNIGNEIAKILRNAKYDHENIKKIENNSEFIQRLYGLTLPGNTKNDVLCKQLIKYYEKLVAGNLPTLPIEFHFEVGKESLDSLSRQCKYAIKLEDKGFANNSSSIINVISRGLITFTNPEKMTSDDFKSGGSYEGAVIFVDLKEQVVSIFKTIASREGEPNQDTNRKTLTQLRHSIDELFSPARVSNNHLEIYNNLKRGSHERL